MAVKSTKDGFPLILDLSAQGIKIKFHDSSEVSEFLRVEMEQWGALLSAIPNRQLMGMDVAAVAGRNAVKKAQQVFHDSAEGALAALNAYDKERPVVLRGTFGKLLQDRDGETQAQTAGTLWASAAMLGAPSLHQASNPHINMHDMAAVTFGQQKLANGLQRLKNERAQTLQLTEELNDQLNEAKANNIATSELLSRAKDELEAVTKRHDEDTARVLEAFEKSITGLRENAQKRASDDLYQVKASLTEHLRASTEEIEEFKRKVRIDVGLEEPTNFWTEKANGHRWVAGCFGILFLAAVVVMVLWIDGYAVDLVADAVDRIVGERQAAALSLVPIAFITVPALAFAWVLRHLSRIIIQNLSLEADARLRGTITRTFKALAADRAMNDAELAIALQALFRPIDGKDHSEIAPPSLGDILKLGSDGKGQ